MANRRARRQPELERAAKAAKTSNPSLPSTLLFLALVLYLGGLVFRLGFQEVRLLQQGRLLESERVAALAQHRALRAEIASAKTNAGIEKLAREQLGFVMDREVPVKAVLAAAPSEAEHTAPVLRAPEAQPVGLPPAMAALAKFFVPLWP
ncbi:MAG: hypothetical protein VKP62_00265 [Candidatus Sericytochromatia bacterium]|nr:hypothetical protein [Candidatus Sericytochromatia bacterium]